MAPAPAPVVIIPVQSQPPPDDMHGPALWIYVAVTLLSIVVGLAVIGYIAWTELNDWLDRRRNQRRQPW